MEPATPKKPLAAVLGGYQLGKSTLVNCLLDDKYAPTGQGLATTRHNCRFCFGEAEEAWVVASDGATRLPMQRREELFAPKVSLKEDDDFLVTAWKPVLKEVDLVDTPGLNERDAVDRQAQRVLALPELEVVIVVVDRMLDERMTELLRQIDGSGRKALCVLNCREIERWEPSDEMNADICDQIAGTLENCGVDGCLLPVEGKRVLPVNALWAWYALGHLERDLDLRDENAAKNAKSDVKRITDYWRNYMSCEAPTKQEILEASGVLVLRHALESYVEFSRDYMLSNHGLELERLTKRWLAECRRMLKTEKNK